MEKEQQFICTASAGKVFFYKPLKKVVGRRIFLKNEENLANYEEIDETDERAKRYFPANRHTSLEQARARHEALRHKPE